MSDDRFIKHPALPFAECRRSKNSERQYKPHMHKTFSIEAIDRGEVTYLVDGRAARLWPGSLGLINPETLHSCNPEVSCQRSYSVLHLDVDWCKRLQQSMWPVEAFRPAKSIVMHDVKIYRQFIDVMNVLMEPVLVDFVKTEF